MPNATLLRTRLALKTPSPQPKMMKEEDGNGRENLKEYATLRKRRTNGKRTI
jgi:hypothetical protein